MASFRCPVNYGCSEAIGPTAGYVVDRHSSAIVIYRLFICMRADVFYHLLSKWSYVQWCDNCDDEFHTRFRTVGKLRRSGKNAMNWNEIVSDCWRVATRNSIGHTTNLRDGNASKITTSNIKWGTAAQRLRLRPMQCLHCGWTSSSYKC